MIEFRGKISNDCKKYIIKRAKLISFLASSLVASVFLIPFIFLTIKNLTFLIAVISLLFVPFISFIPIPEKSVNLLIPISIKIYDNKIQSNGNKFNYLRNIESVKKIIDYGEWYQIYFYYSKRCENFICQKDLIKVGTIEEFEKFFEGKIVRKTK